METIVAICFLLTILCGFLVAPLVLLMDFYPKTVFTILAVMFVLSWKYLR